jgi:Kef-type K+ transport system membrane component KefB
MKVEAFLLAMVLILAAPFLLWRLLGLERFFPLVVVQIVSGILLGPGVLGRAFPGYYAAVFTPEAVGALGGIASWAVMIFVALAGIELDMHAAWQDKRESFVTAGLALGTPLLCGSLAGACLLAFDGWIGADASTAQFVVGVGMACAVTALPILVLLMERLGILHAPLGQRILRYASVDDVVIWAVLALILVDWSRLAAQAGFLLAFSIAAFAFRSMMRRLREDDRWFALLVWIPACALAADDTGLHFMVGAFLAGAVVDANWFRRARLDAMRHDVLLAFMPVFFLSTGLRTHWSMSGGAVLLASAILLLASIGGKLIGAGLAAKVLRWPVLEGRIVGWLLQTKALIMIIFASVLLDRAIISAATFTALLLMAVASTMLTVPAVSPLLARLRHAEHADACRATVASVPAELPDRRARRYA